MVWSEAAQQRALDALDAYPRFYDAVKALEWLLERQPDNQFAERLDDTYWVISSEGFPFASGQGLPEVTLLYYFDDRTVTFWDIRITPPRQSSRG